MVIIGGAFSLLVGFALREACSISPFPTAHVSVLLLLWAALMIKLFTFTWR